MSESIRYGDTLHLLNNTNDWSGGYLSVYDPFPNAKWDVGTVLDTYMVGATWRIESGSGKKYGDEVLSGDKVMLRNLYECDGGYLECKGEACQCWARGEHYQVCTAALALPKPLSHQLWVINKEGSSSSTSANINVGDSVSLYNQYSESAGFLDAYGSFNKKQSLWNVYSSQNEARKQTNGLWRITKTADPCPDQYPHKDEPCNNCGGKCGDNPQGGQQCFSLPAGIDFGLNALINSGSTQTIKLFIDGELKDTLSGSGVGNVNPGAKIYNSGQGHVCIEVWANGKMSPLRFADNPLESKPGMAIIGTEDGSDNDYNDTIVVLNWGLK